MCGRTVRWPYVKEVPWIAFGCGHLCVCEACAADIAECPLCRSPVRTKRRIYFD